MGRLRGVRNRLFTPHHHTKCDDAADTRGAHVVITTSLSAEDVFVDAAAEGWDNATAEVVEAIARAADSGRKCRLDSRT